MSNSNRLTVLVDHKYLNLYNALEYEIVRYENKCHLKVTWEWDTATEGIEWYPITEAEAESLDDLFHSLSIG